MNQPEIKSKYFDREQLNNRMQKYFSTLLQNNTKQDRISGSGGGDIFLM